MPVYMIRAGEHGPVKIGWTENVEFRLKALQTANHQYLRVIRLFEGGPAEERMLHRQFADQRLEREWFTFTQAMLGDVGLNETKPLPRPPIAEPPTEEALPFTPEEFEQFGAYWHAVREFRERQSIPHWFAA
jgi:hypothetical protein